MAEWCKEETRIYLVVQTLFVLVFTNLNRQISALAPCDELGASCLQCELSESCFYGRDTQVKCKALNKDICKCQGSKSFTKTFNCRYCYQTAEENYQCDYKTNCKVISGFSPPPRYETNCTVNNDILCLGNRTFHKYLPCNWTSGYRWFTTFILSLTLGGFGVDRFYLGHWKEGLGKLFSFGGLGVWTLVDLVLVAIGYVGPADGSLYIF